MKLLTRHCVAIFALYLVLSASSVRADIVTLNVNSSLSSITLGGSAFTLNYVQQNAGSLSANYGGTIVADLTGGVFTFTGTSSISAIVNPNGPYTTAPNIIGVESGNYGVTASGVVPGFGQQTINGVYKGIVLNLGSNALSGTAQNGSALASNLIFSAGTLDYGIAPASVVGSSDLTNDTGANTSTSVVTWNGTTLTIPVAFQTLGSNRIQNWSGTIVANIVAVPEPSSIALTTLVGAVGIGYASLRLRRKQRVGQV